MRKNQILDILNSTFPQQSLSISGWVRTKRNSKSCNFIELNDGSTAKNLQIVLDHDKTDSKTMNEITTGAAIKVKGQLIESPSKGQKWELHCDSIEIIGRCPSDYPLQKKGHSFEFLREISHIRPRSNLFSCMFRIRSRLAFAIHNYFNLNNFFYIHTPIITESDCEGAGELFQVSTLNFNNLPMTESKQVDFSKDFFGKPTYLTVSGQLEAELLATSLSRVYTFGPTFRAENSNTPRHMAEFWMIEPEMAFFELNDNYEIAQDFLKYVVKDCLKHCHDDLQVFNRFIDKGLESRLDLLINAPFEVITYNDAVNILNKSNKSFEFEPEYGINLQTEHERYLSEDYFKKPVIIINYPKEIKPFYMRQNDDEKTVAAMDIVVPQIGELIGGSQREERLDMLKQAMRSSNINQEEYNWYMDTRKFGTIPHSGFGLGFERLIMMVTGMKNIRDVIPFPRTPGHAKF